MNGCINNLGSTWSTLLLDMQSIMPTVWINWISRLIQWFHIVSIYTHRVRLRHTKEQSIDTQLNCCNKVGGSNIPRGHKSSKILSSFREVHLTLHLSRRSQTLNVLTHRASINVPPTAVMTSIPIGWQENCLHYRAKQWQTKGIELWFYVALSWNNFWEQFFGDRKQKSGYWGTYRDVDMTSQTMLYDSMICFSLPHKRETTKHVTRLYI